MNNSIETLKNLGYIDCYIQSFQINNSLLQFVVTKRIAADKQLWLTIGFLIQLSSFEIQSIGFINHSLLTTQLV